MRVPCSFVAVAFVVATATAAAAQPANAADCVYELEEGLVVEQSVLDADSYSSSNSSNHEATGNALLIRLVYEGEAWLGFGFSPGGQMVGSTVVIGVPFHRGYQEQDEYQVLNEEDEGRGEHHAGVYYLAGKDLESVRPAEEGPGDPAATTGTAPAVLDALDALVPGPFSNADAPMATVPALMAEQASAAPAPQSPIPSVSPTTTATITSTGVPTPLPTPGTTTRAPLPVPARRTAAPTPLASSAPSDWFDKGWRRRLVLPGEHGPHRRMLTTSDHSLIQNGTHTVLSFVKHLDQDDGGDNNNTTGVDALFDRFIYAVGQSNTLGYHRIRGMDSRSNICDQGSAATPTSTTTTTMAANIQEAASSSSLAESSPPGWAVIAFVFLASTCVAWVPGVV